ncbi:MAG: ATP-binding protein [Chthoniobacteraceae bacterium]|nr:ATP-binding protein [Chthoniobacteraceae bacterium]
MLAKIYSAAVFGVEAFEVEIEVNAARGGDPKIIIVGLPDAAVKESRDRVTTAVSNSGYQWPHSRTTINLAPADIKKEGPSFDLPIALGMIAVREEIDLTDIERFCFVGELALTGAVRPVKGVLSIALEARRRGRTRVVVPEANAREAAMVDGIEVFGVRTLREAFEFLTGAQTLLPVNEDLDQFFARHQNYEADFADVRGQHHVKRAVEIAVSGGHNVLMIGPPGSGKSMIAKRIATIIPPMTLEEAIESTKIHSICGLLIDPEHAFVAVRPFRSPHHTISDAGLLGGSSSPSPGEVSIAHNGVLFLDELPEFHRSTLEVLRQPLEDGRVTISRAAGTMTFPADFMLVAAMNPCPCGYYGDPKRECRCSPQQIERYRDRISGPLLDRIDIHLEVPPVQYRELASDEPGEASCAIRQRVDAVRALQQNRFLARNSGNGHVRCNARMTSRMIKTFCALDPEAAGLMEMAMNELHFSARAYDRILKVARTIADLEGAADIAAHHVAEAIQYRTLDRNLWA